MSKGGTGVGTFGGMGFYVIVSLLAYGVPTANGSQQLIVMRTLSAGNVRAFVGVG